jgi:cytochrome b561
MTPSSRYDAATMTLHWLTAGLIVALFALAEVWLFLRRGTWLRLELQWIHVSLGLILSVVFILRLVWRFSFAKRIPHATTGFTHLVATSIHLSLYVLLAVQVALGFLFRWAQGPVSLFGLFAIPSPIVISLGARHWIAFLHYYSAWLIIIMACGHALAALIHHYVMRDGILRRMLPLR